MTAKDQYRKFCTDTPELPLFFKDWYLDIVCFDGNWDVVTVEENGKIVAVHLIF
jgi:hypothetical protein